MVELTLARSKSACFRCLQKVTEERECGRITGSPWTSSFTKTLRTITPFTSHKRSVGIIQSNQPPEPKEQLSVDQRKPPHPPPWGSPGTVGYLPEP